MPATETATETETETETCTKAMPRPLLPWLALAPALTLVLALLLPAAVLRPLATAGVAVLVWGAATAAYRLWLHPLARVPGPRPAAVTSVWHAYRLRQGRMLPRGSTALHRRYGPIVRIAPDEVTLNTKEALQAIYTGARYIKKSPWYHAVSPTPVIDWRFRRVPGPAGFALNGELDVAVYKARRRNIGPTYARGAVARYGPRLDGVLRDWVDALARLGGDVDVDLAEWLHIAVTEMLTAATLDCSPGFIAAATDRDSLRPSLARWRFASVIGHFPAALTLVQRFPSLRRPAACLLGMDPDAGHPLGPPDKRLLGLALGRAAEEKAPGRRPDRPDLLQDLLDTCERRPDWTRLDAARMALATVTAGHETTTSAALSAISLICSTPRVKQRLSDELAAAPAADDEGSSTYLQACVREALRLRGVVTMSIPREVPAEAGAGAGLELEGFRLPPGTKVGVNPASLHLNPDLFGPDAEEYRPERWLESDEAWARLDKLSLAWGGGPHTCPGKNLAELMLYKLVPTVIRHFDVEVQVPPLDRMDTFNYIGILQGVRARFHPRERQGP